MSDKADEAQSPAVPEQLVPGQDPAPTVPTAPTASTDSDAGDAGATGAAGESAAAAAASPDDQSARGTRAPASSAAIDAKPARGYQGRGDKRGKRTRNPRKTREIKSPEIKKMPLELLREGLLAISTAYRSLRQRTGAQYLAESQSGKANIVDLDLSFKLPLNRKDVPEAAQRLLLQLRKDLENEVFAAGQLVPGRTWSFQSESFDDDICRPGDPRQVLTGYGLEGRPRFADLVTLAIERKHEAVDDLLAGKEGAVHFVEKGSSITEDVKPVFDPEKVPYVLLAQGMIGLFESSEEGRRVALTIQVLAHKTAEGNTTFLAHPVCAIDLHDLPSGSIRRIIRGLQAKLTELGPQTLGRIAAGEEVDLTEAVSPLLRDCLHQLSHDARNRERKTDHARDRESESQRPTQLAFPEARSARDHHLYIDTEEGTVVVVGKSGRIHVFSTSGRHVTTVILPPSSVRNRIHSGRWRRAEPAERGSFREAIANASGAS